VTLMKLGPFSDRGIECHGPRRGADHVRQVGPLPTSAGDPAAAALLALDGGDLFNAFDSFICGG
jgi:hypothetical protein